jgi:hypothetical protein
MNPGGDAAEQVVRMSLEGFEVVMRISGTGAKNLAVLLAAVLKEEQKTSGKARLTNMLKSGRPLKVYTIRQKDLSKFCREAKRYGVLYCVLKDKNDRGENAVVDIMAREDDASKIQRITERFRFDTVDRATVVGGLEKEKDSVFPKMETAEKVSDRESGREPKIVRREDSRNETDFFTESGSGHLYGKPSQQEGRSAGSIGERNRASVREKLEGYKKKAERSREGNRMRQVVRPPKKVKEKGR